MKTFSIIIPVHNGEKFIHKCLSSLLNQSRMPDEIIVVDDGSTDKTWEQIQEWISQHSLIKGIRVSRQGVSNARNCGSSISKSDYILFLDVDDCWDPDKLFYHEKHISEHPCCKFSFSLSRIIEEGSNKCIMLDTPQIKKPTLFNILMHEYQILGSSSSVCFEKEFFDSLGGFSTGLSRGEDWEMWVRSTSRAIPCEIPQNLVSIYRRKDSVEQSTLDGIRNFYSTELHLKIWTLYVSEIQNSDFSRLAIRILFADLWKNRFKLVFCLSKYRKLFVNEGAALMSNLGIRGTKFLVLQISYLYLRNRRKNNA